MPAVPTFGKPPQQQLNPHAKKWILYAEWDWGWGYQNNKYNNNKPFCMGPHNKRVSDFVVFDFLSGYLGLGYYLPYIVDG